MISPRLTPCAKAAKTGYMVGETTLNQCVAEELVVRIRHKHALAIIAALNDVLRLTGNNDSRKAGHGERLCYWLGRAQG